MLVLVRLAMHPWSQKRPMERRAPAWDYGKMWAWRVVVGMLGKFSPHVWVLVMVLPSSR